MESASFSVLCEGIGLSESDVATIRGQLQDTAYTSLRAFEVTAQVSLGASRVLVPPLNESIVRRNWYVSDIPRFVLRSCVPPA